MSDTDKAQWNASLAELPTPKVLMCWFRVCQNVFKQARAKGVDPDQTWEFFVDLYDLLYSDERDYETNKQAILANGMRCHATQQRSLWLVILRLCESTALSSEISKCSIHLRVVR
ncbi:hypothetical protein F442_11510 [Phytophthora nicotianae P10297]|uniref:Uncharacterized protein n=1 Tax=Phytophthora nicotianae P10297 TaxID=1317064 RepID=W2Z2M5_PHYNI|nr:hypothetical protein F442_11510 [Phytophthora nicotianae P10297]